MMNTPKENTASEESAPPHEETQDVAPELKDLLGQVTKLSNSLSDLENKTHQLEEMAPLKKDGGEGDGDEEMETHQPFQESAYALIYISNMMSLPFLYGLFVYCTQMATITLTLVDIVDWSAEVNPLRVPAMVDLTVTASQAVSVFLALAYQQDLIKAVLKLHDGYYPELLEAHPYATYNSWLLSCVMQLIAGLLLLTTIFVLTMQSSDVLSIMLNFAALHFMAEIDDLGFSLAKWGFITVGIQKQTKVVAEFEVPKREKGTLFRRVLYFIMLTTIFIGYGVIKNMQLQGDWLSTNLYVQFGEGFEAKLAFYSGIFATEIGRTSGHREYRDAGTGTMLLSYCVSEKIWTFSETEDSCDYFAKSESTRSYDVTSIPDYEWVIKDDVSSRFAPFDSFTLISRDCDEDTCNGECGDDGLCQCPPDRFGVDCEYDDVCPSLSMSGSGVVFPTDPNGGAVQSTDYHLFRDPETGHPVSVYNMPVFYSNASFPANFIFFGGRRWILSGESEFISEAMTGSNATFPQETANYLQDKAFHGHFGDQSLSPYFFSEPVDFQSPDFRPSPAGLGWVSVVASTNVTSAGYSIGTVLECHVE